MVGRKTQPSACCRINLGDCEGVNCFPTFYTKAIFGTHVEKVRKKKQLTGHKIQEF